MTDFPSAVFAKSALTARVRAAGFRPSRAARLAAARLAAARLAAARLAAARLAAAATAVVTGASSCGDDCTPAWTTAAGELDRVVLAAWGRTADDVYAVGGGLGVPGAGALVLRYDGSHWTELPTGRSETLWWVAGVGNEVWMVGERGLVLRWDGRAFHPIPSGTTAPLYGVFGAAPDDVWIVGGEPGPDGPDDVVLHWDGERLAPDPTFPRAGAALFKVWGPSADELWISGEAGTLIRRIAGGWEVHSLPTPASLFTVHGCGPDRAFVVGGPNVFRWNGIAWSAVTDLVLGAAANGVACGENGDVLVVGSAGLKLRHDATTGRWIDEQLQEPWDVDFHGAFVAPDGKMLAVGGNFLDPASAGPRRGVIARFGCP